MNNFNQPPQAHRDQMNKCMLSKTSFLRINCKLYEPNLEAIDTFSSEYWEFEK